jgi:hypothetical protein
MSFSKEGTDSSQKQRKYTQGYPANVEQDPSWEAEEVREAP